MYKMFEPESLQLNKLNSVHLQEKSFISSHRNFLSLLMLLQFLHTDDTYQNKGTIKKQQLELIYVY